MVVSFEDLPQIRKKHKSRKIVLGGGVFDLIHVGHLKYIQILREQGDVVVVMVKSDERVRIRKHHSRPIISEADRVRMVDAIKGVDYVFIAPHDPQATEKIDAMHESVLSALRPDVFVSTNPVWQKLEKLGATKIAIGDREDDGNSTTKIIERVLIKNSHKSDKK